MYIEREDSKGDLVLRLRAADGKALRDDLWRLQQDGGLSQQCADLLGLLERKYGAVDKGGWW
jgi:hypothetical protein